jgi:fatty-acid peroxygenase
MTSHCPHEYGLVRTGYPYLLDLRRQAEATSVDLRLLGQRTTVLSGPDGARLFYDESVMRRRGAIPRPLRHTLFGLGAVHGLDDADHKHRKALFVDLLTPAAAKAIAEAADAGWRERAGQQVEPAAMYDEAVQVHAAAVTEWAGIPVGQTYPKLPRDLAAMVDGFGSIGPRHLAARRARHRSERWATGLITAVRSGELDAPGTTLDAVARYRGRDAELLSPRVAAVELLNILRPTVAVAYFVAFTADALAAQPEMRERLRSGGDELFESLAHEVRRYYPFVPMLAARVRTPSTHDGRRLRRRQRVLLDVYGTLHDPQWWDEPERFELDRFVGVDVDPFLYIPQGGGDAASGHRCPGERVSVELIKTAARHLVDDRPPVRNYQGYPLTRFPTRPLS